MQRQSCDVFNCRYGQRRDAALLRDFYSIGQSINQSRIFRPVARSRVRQLPAANRIVAACLPQKRRDRRCITTAGRLHHLTTTRVTTKTTLTTAATATITLTELVASPDASTRQNSRVRQVRGRQLNELISLPNLFR